MIEVLGQRGVPQVQQAPGTELCFAAMVSALSDKPVEEIQDTLAKEGVSESDGSTAFSFIARYVRLGDSQDIIMMPLQKPSELELTTGEIIDRIDEQLDEGTAIALLHKKLPNPDEPSYHWFLVTARYLEASGKPILYGIMDPLKSERTYMEPKELREVVDRSQNFNGVYIMGLAVV